MPPKSPRKISLSGRDVPATAAAKAAQSVAMPPPPDPIPPQGILEPEMTALSACLRSAVVKTGQVYGFYADVRKLDVQQYAAHPPRSLTASLGREVEKYDQLCDAMENHLHRAIAVLQRDLHREEERLKAEAAAAAAAKVPTPQADPPAPSTSTPPASPTQSMLLTGDSSSTAQTSKSSLPTPARRQSTVSLSSLQRPPFPHKLDLSSTPLRFNPDEVLASGLSSPVTLAPKSSHRNIPQELMEALDASSRPVDIDLTAGDNEMEIEMQHAAEAAAAAVSLDPALGSSADKPIELDLDMDLDMFDPGANIPTNAQVEHYFHAAPGFTMGNSQDPGSSSNVRTKEEDDLFLLNAFKAVGPDDTGDAGDIFGSLEASLRTAPFSNGLPHTQPPDSNAMRGAPSPASLLASFSASSSPPTNSSVPNSGPSYPNPIDFSFSSTSDMESLFSMGGGNASPDGKV